MVVVVVVVEVEMEMKIVDEGLGGIGSGWEQGGGGAS